MVPAVGQGLLLLTAGVALHLVHHRRHLRLQQGLQMMGQEVRDPNGPDPPLLVQFGHGPPGLTVDVLPVVKPVGRGRPVDEVEVQIVQPQLLHGPVKGPQSTLIPPVCVPDLAGHKDRLPGQAAGPDRLAHTSLILIVRRCVNVPVAQFQSLLDGRHRLRPLLHLPGAKPQTGNGHAVGQGKGLPMVFHVVALLFLLNG